MTVGAVDKLVNFVVVVVFLLSTTQCLLNNLNTFTSLTSNSHSDRNLYDATISVEGSSIKCVTAHVWGFDSSNTFYHSISTILLYYTRTIYLFIYLLVIFGLSWFIMSALYTKEEKKLNLFPFYTLKSFYIMTPLKWDPGTFPKPMQAMAGSSSAAVWSLKNLDPDSDGNRCEDSSCLIPDCVIKCWQAGDRYMCCVTGELAFSPTLSLRPE